MQGLVFSSLEFIFVFLPVVLLIYFLTLRLFKDHSQKITALNLVLLISSLFFYIRGEGKFVWVMLLVGSIDYFIALIIERVHDQKVAKASDAKVCKFWLIVSIISNMGLLFYFKYINFAVDFYFDIAKSMGLGTPGTRLFFEVTLPIGISFYTFESMSYIFDVYRRETKATKNLISYWAFITFFPHLVAGPIIRYVELRKQLDDRSHTWEQMLLGFRLFSIGLAKKAIIANPMGYHADYLFSLDPSKLDFSTAWIAAISYTLQIYFDFSGYSDMAIGLGRMFGINLPQNFNYPYIAKSVQEFWRRWHITLSTWFRDYVYIPLGGSRKGPIIEYRNLFLVFVFCGLWHGASWNFLNWGIFHGLFLVIERIVKSKVKWEAPAFLSHLYTLLVVMFAWVIFRSETMSQCWEIWEAMLGLRGISISTETWIFITWPFFSVYVLLGIYFAIPLNKYFGEKKIARLLSEPRLSYEFIFLGLFILSSIFLCGKDYNPFIYFRF